jgi:hypothetical protein
MLQSPTLPCCRLHITMATFSNCPVDFTLWTAFNEMSFKLPTNFFSQLPIARIFSHVPKLLLPQKIKLHLIFFSQAAMWDVLSSNYNFMMNLIP